MLKSVINSLQKLFTIEFDFIIQLLFTVLIVIITIVIVRLSSFITSKSKKKIITRYKIVKIFTYIFYGLALITIGKLWFKNFESLTSFVGFFSIGAAFVLRDLLLDICGWILIVIGKPFDVGDRIEIGEDKGDVVDIRLFQFSILEIGNWVDSEQSTGRIIHIPNSKVLSQRQINYTKGFKYIWNEISIQISFSSNWKKAKEIISLISLKYYNNIKPILDKYYSQLENRSNVLYPPITTPKVYSNIKETGIVLTLRYLCEPKMRRESANTIIEEIMEEFKNHQDDIFFSNNQNLKSFEHEKENSEL